MTPVDPTYYAWQDHKISQYLEKLNPDCRQTISYDDYSRLKQTGANLHGSKLCLGQLSVEVIEWCKDYLDTTPVLLRERDMYGGWIFSEVFLLFKHDDDRMLFVMKWL